MDDVNIDLCPVCGYELGFLPWEGASASDEICPCCFIQFGYDDCAGGDQKERPNIYEKWRTGWVLKGMKWHSKRRRPPEGWDPIAQLRAIGVHVDS